MLAKPEDLLTESDVELRALSSEGRTSILTRLLRIDEAHGTESYKPKEPRRSPAAVSERLFVANLSFDVKKDEVRGLFADHGITAIDVFLLTDSQTGRSRGCGFVSVSTIDDARRAIDGLNGVKFRGRELVVRPADPRGERDVD